MFTVDDLLISSFSDKLTACSISCKICFIFRSSDYRYNEPTWQTFNRMQIWTQYHVPFL